jgi:hypothetical protein
VNPLLIPPRLLFRALEDLHTLPGGARSRSAASK